MDLTLPQIWLIIGLLMLFAELLSVALVFVFFAVGALLTALLASIGILPDLNAQLLAFSVISVLSLLLFRKQARHLLDRRKRTDEYNEYSGETAMVIKDIPPTGEGKIYYRGAEWIALSARHSLIEAGSKVIIRKTDGIKLIVEET
ncbi:NfeD family protein [Arundinibacter roseus]|uniref:NfeD family protein n=1 Tax=Arundinibacter roseus TaxID=2070510 RepID=A0A4R4JV83_9BACT|nr:NfeD family protein [Arundinibacter roseus]TDB58687.1 NfeD family protein [Arundinibacter roseus]